MTTRKPLRSSFLYHALVGPGALVALLALGAGLAGGHFGVEWLPLASAAGFLSIYLLAILNFHVGFSNARLETAHILTSGWPPKNQSPVVAPYPLLHPLPLLPLHSHPGRASPHAL